MTPDVQFTDHDQKLRSTIALRSNMMYIKVDTRVLMLISIEITIRLSEIVGIEIKSVSEILNCSY